MMFSYDPTNSSNDLTKLHPIPFANISFHLFGKI